MSKVESPQNAVPRVFRPRHVSTLNPSTLRSPDWIGTGDGQPSTFSRLRAFTLVELLVVISIIAVLAALLLPVAGVVRKQSMINTARAEMAQLETAIDSYKAAYGFYPPNANNPSVLINQLYYELGGTTNIAVSGSAPVYQPLSGGPSLTSNEVFTAFGVTGFANCSKTNAEESTPPARNFLPDLKPRQIGIEPTNNVTILVTSVGGPDRNYPLNFPDLNPWRYSSPSLYSTNTSSQYDLWVQLQISGTKYLICNWDKQVQINSSPP